MARPLTPSLPHARQASRILALCGAESELIADCGVAGLHRLLGQLDRCAKCAGGMAWQRPAALTDVFTKHRVRSADVVVCVAGMDCALPSVVAGLVEAPVVAVPTSVGYGARCVFEDHDALTRGKTCGRLTSDDARHSLTAQSGRRGGAPLGTQRVRARRERGQHRQRLRRRDGGRQDAAARDADGQEMRDEASKWSR